MGLLAKADAAQAELTVDRMRSAAADATRVGARAVLRLAVCLGDHRFLCQNMPPNFTTEPISIVDTNNIEMTTYWNSTMPLEHLAPLSFLQTVALKASHLLAIQI